MNTNYPLRNDFIIRTKVSQGYIIVRYEQASMKESFKLAIKTGEELNNWIIDFIESRIEYQYYLPKRWYETQGMYAKRQYIFQSIMLKELDLKKLIDTIVETRFKKLESIFENAPKVRSEKPARQSVFSCSVQAVCEKYNIKGPEELFNNYTNEQYQWMVDGLIFQGNEYSDEGKEVNDIILSGSLQNAAKEKETQETLAKIREFTKRYEASGNIKLKK